MDLTCSLKTRWGKTQWAAGYQITVGLDGIARNVPDVAGERMLTNPAVWTRFDGKAPAATPQPGILRPLGALPQVGILVPEPPPPPPSHVPKTLALLDGLAPEVLGAVASQFDVDAALEEDPARAILARADEQFAASITAFVASLAVPVEAPAAETTVPASAPPSAGVAVVPGPQIASTPPPPQASTAGTKKTTADKKAAAGSKPPPSPPVIGKEATAEDAY